MNSVLHNSVRIRRTARGWSQAELAQRAGISRTAVSAIEGDRLVPSVAAALSLAGVLECTVEALFGSANESVAAQWAWQPAAFPCRYWTADVGGRTLLFPVESSRTGMVAHDGVARTQLEIAPSSELALKTLVVASCDPAAAFLAEQYAQRSGFRLLVISRSSRKAAELLAAGLVHAAGLHWSRADNDGNSSALHEAGLAGEAALLRLATWEEGVAHSPAVRLGSARAALGSKLHWVGREEGSGARRCLDELLKGRAPPRRQARDHWGVAEAIASGWADAGICVRFVSDQAQLDFLPIWQEEYDLAFSRQFESDPRVQALVETVRSRAYRSLLSDLPGYHVENTGTLQHV